MKNKFPFKILGLSLGLILLTVMACKKSDPQPSKTDLLSKDWKLSDVLANVGGTPSSVFSFFDDCVKDDVYKFANNNTYQISEGATKCDPSDPDIYDAGTWTFLDSETKIKLSSAGGGSDTLNIQELTSTSLKVSSTVDVSGTPTEATLVFSPN